MARKSPPVYVGGWIETLLVLVARHFVPHKSPPVYVGGWIETRLTVSVLARSGESPPVYVGGWIETLGWSLYSQPLTVVATGVRRWLD